MNFCRLGKRSVVGETTPIRTANEPQHTDAYWELYFILLRKWIKNIENL